MKIRRRKKASLAEETFTVVEMEDFETVCRVCDAEFLDEEDLKLHVAQVHLKESHGKTICKVCCAVLSSADQFVSHFIFKHLENSFFCYYCYRVFTDPSALDQHELTHCAVADDAALTCSQCSNILINRQELIKHEFQEHRDSENGVLLNNFFSLLSGALNIKIHKFVEALHKNALLTCRRCNYSASSLKGFIEHLKTVKCQCLSCDNCFNVYKKKHSIMNHVLKNRQCYNYIIENDIQYRCPKCEKFFNSKDISRHKESCKVIRCLTCMKQCNTVQELTDHTIQEHRVSISLETCKFCKRSFVGTLSLKKHMSRSHKNQNMYKYNCAYCSSMFTHPSKLFAHFFSRHKHIWPYSCQICNKHFRLRKHFTIHIKLQHKSVGFVEFGENLHVIFTDKKSENPEESQANFNMDNSTDCSDSDNNSINRENITPTTTMEQPEHEGKQKNTEIENNNMIHTSQSTESPEKVGFENVNTSNGEITKLIGTVEIERLNPPRVRRKRKKRMVRPSQIKTSNNPDPLSDSEEEPLSKIRESLLKKKTQNLSNIKKRIALRNKTAKLTCKFCNKYCYTVQNYHHHLTLHEKTKLKRCIKCHQYFKSRKELTEHIQRDHASSKLIETLKSVLEKRKKILPVQKPSVRPGESLKHLLEKRRREQRMIALNTATNKFRRTIRKVNINDDCTATITPMSDHGLSVKKFIETFKPDVDNVNISNSVTIKALTASVDKDPLIKMHRFDPEPLQETYIRLRFPEKFKDPPAGFMDSKVNVKLVQQLVTKPKLVNMTYNERIPQVQQRSQSEEYCNMFADETDYTQYKNDVIPEVAQEVMLEHLEDIPRTRRLAQEIIIPRIPEEHGEVRIGHLLPQAPFYKIVKVKKLIKAADEAETAPTPEDANVQLPDGTRLISVKNPYAHLIPNEHLQEVLKANKSKYYTPKPKNIEKAIAKALNQMRTSRERRQKRLTNNVS